ncbi:MAG: type II toxin-antitoxin system PemK/MazF family toxin [Acutalibacteraceae bacterium]
MKQVKRGEIYFADLSPVVGSEQMGTRPVLILQNDKGNKHSPTTIVAAITSRKTKHSLPTHVKISTDSLQSESVVLLEQIRTIDKSRLGDYVDRLDKDMMGRVDHAVITSLGIKVMEELLK